MPELNNICGRIANRLFFGSFFSTEKKEHVPQNKTPDPLKVDRGKKVAN